MNDLRLIQHLVCRWTRDSSRRIPDTGEHIDGLTWHMGPSPRCKYDDYNTIFVGDLPSLCIPDVFDYVIIHEGGSWNPSMFS